MEHKFSENGFFQGLIETKNPVTVITTNGFHMHGTILAESDSMINMQRDSGESVIIYKHAISTIVYGTPAPYSPVAQLVEQGIENPRIVGSSPAGRAHGLWPEST